MKKVNNIYDNIIDIKKVMDMYDRKIKVHTKNKSKIIHFDYNYVSNITYILQILESKKYIPGKYNIFLVKEPKVRLIMSQNILDKVINHVVSKYLLVNIFEPSLVDFNIATRINKGTDYGIKLFKRHLNELKDKDFYILKLDISKFFYNIDHNIIKELLKKI